MMLECRRRGIPSAGLQHGFIHRHWLNYRHEADEIAPDAAAPADRGFPCPTRTLLFDDFARQHLETAGGFPPAALASPAARGSTRWSRPRTLSRPGTLPAPAPRPERRTPAAWCCS